MIKSTDVLDNGLPTQRYYLALIWMVIPSYLPLPMYRPLSLLSSWVCELSGFSKLLLIWFSFDLSITKLTKLLRGGLVFFLMLWLSCVWISNVVHKSFSVTWIVLNCNRHESTSRTQDLKSTYHGIIVIPGLIYHPGKKWTTKNWICWFYVLILRFYQIL